MIEWFFELGLKKIYYKLQLIRGSIVKIPPVFFEDLYLLFQFYLHPFYEST